MRKTKTEYKIRLLGLYAISTHNLIFSVILQWWWWIEPENVGGLYIGLLEAKFTPLSTWVLLPLAMTSTLRHVKTFDFSFSLRFVVFDKSIVLSKFQILFSANIFNHQNKTCRICMRWKKKLHWHYCKGLPVPIILYHLGKNLFEFVSRIRIAEDNKRTI